MMTRRVAGAAAVHAANGANGALAGAQGIGTAAALRARAAAWRLGIQINAGLSVVYELLRCLGQHGRLLGDQSNRLHGLLQGKESDN